MAGISSKAVLKTLSAYKYNAGSELEDEGELNYYNTFYRKYDAQIGRFTGIDMLAESYAGLTPFQFGNNNPVFYNDPTGAALNYVDPDKEQWVHQSGNVFWGASHQSDVRDGIGMDGEYSAGSFDNGFSGGGAFGFGSGSFITGGDGNLSFGGDFAASFISGLQTGLASSSIDNMEIFSVYNNGNLIGNVFNLNPTGYEENGFGGANLTLGYRSLDPNGPQNVNWIQMVETNNPSNVTGKVGELYIDVSDKKDWQDIPYLNTQKARDEFKTYIPELMGTDYKTWVYDKTGTRFKEDNKYKNTDWFGYISLVDMNNNNAILIQFCYGYSNYNGHNTYFPLYKVNPPIKLVSFP